MKRSASPLPSPPNRKRGRPARSPGSSPSASLSSPAPLSPPLVCSPINYSPESPESSVEPMQDGPEEVLQDETMQDLPAIAPEEFSAITSLFTREESFHAIPSGSVELVDRQAVVDQLSVEEQYTLLKQLYSQVTVPNMLDVSKCVTSPESYAREIAGVFERRWGEPPAGNTRRRPTPEQALELELVLVAYLSRWWVRTNKDVGVKRVVPMRNGQCTCVIDIMPIKKFLSTHEPESSKVYMLNDRFYTTINSKSLSNMSELEMHTIRHLFIYSRYTLRVAGIQSYPISMFARYENGVRVNPFPGEVDDPRFFNTWQPFPFTVAEMPLMANHDAIVQQLDACPLLRHFFRHIFYVISKGNDEIYMGILTWIAVMIQRPWHREQTILSLTGRPGAGKSIIFVILSKLIGEDKVTFRSNFTGSRFDSLFFGKLLVVGDEISWEETSTRTVDALKTMVATEKGMVEKKYMDPTEAPNYARVVAITNGKNGTPNKQKRARRFFQADCETERISKMYVEEKSKGTTKEIQEKVFVKNYYVDLGKCKTDETFHRALFSYMANFPLQKVEAWINSPCPIPPAALVNVHSKSLYEAAKTDPVVCFVVWLLDNKCNHGSEWVEEIYVRDLLQTMGKVVPTQVPEDRFIQEFRSFCRGIDKRERLQASSLMSRRRETKVIDVYMNMGSYLDFLSAVEREFGRDSFKPILNERTPSSSWHGAFSGFPGVHMLHFETSNGKISVPVLNGKFCAAFVDEKNILEVKTEEGWKEVPVVQLKIRDDMMVAYGGETFRVRTPEAIKNYTAGECLCGEKGVVGGDDIMNYTGEVSCISCAGLLGSEAFCRICGKKDAASGDWFILTPRGEGMCNTCFST